MRKNCISCRMAKELLAMNVRRGFKCLITGISHHVLPLTCNLCITEEDIEAARKEVKDAQEKSERAIENKLTCSSCSFASWTDADSLPIGSIQRSVSSNREIFYCSERNTGVPGPLEGCELHSGRNKDTESHTDEVNSLGNTIDECFHEMKLLIEAGMNVGADLAREKSKTAYIFHVPIDSDELQTAKATIEKLSEESQANRELVASLEEAISNCLGPYDKKNMAATDQLAALKVCNEKLSKDNKDLRNKNKILQQEVALLKKKNSELYSRFSHDTDLHKECADKYSRLAGERIKLKEKVSSLEKELDTANLDRVATELVFNCIAK